MLAPAAQRRMTLLALVAMLLLLALPTVGRVLSTPADDSGGVWAQLCTIAGLKLVKIAPGGADPFDPPAPKPPPGGMPDGMDCAYCPLLGGMVLLLCLFLAAPVATRAPSLPWRRVAPRAFLHPSGLGSRGPPLMLRKA